MEKFFIFNNLKINSFLPQDKPLPGFKVLTLESESHTYGTLFDMGVDAGFTNLIINNKVLGQIWVCEEPDRIPVLEDYSGVYTGLTEPVKITVNIEFDDYSQQIEATTFRLKNISKSYDIVKGEQWFIKKHTK